MNLKLHVEIIYIGIWIRDIRYKTNLNHTQTLNKILKNLESKKLIKAVKSVSVSHFSIIVRFQLRAKMFIKFDL